MSIPAANAPVPWWSRIPGILAYPANGRGAIATVFLGVVAWFGGHAGFHPFALFVRLACAGIVFSALFLVTRESADGGTEVPELAINDVWDDVLVPGLKATALGVFLSLPVLYCLYRLAMTGVEGLAGSAFAADEEAAREAAMAAAASVAAWIAAAIACGIGAAVLYPLCFIVLAIGRSLRMALFPVVWFSILSQVHVAYLGLLLGVGGLAALGAIASIPFALAGNVIPILPGILSSMVSMYFSLCTAHLLGWFVFQYHARLGYTPSPRETMTIDRIQEMNRRAVEEMERARGPGMPGMVQVGTAGASYPMPADGGAPVADAAASRAAASGAPWEAPQEDEVAGLYARFHAAIAARDLASALASAPLLLDAYWDSGAMAHAHAVYGALATLNPDIALDPPRQARLAKEMEAAGESLAAASAWRALALQHPQHPQAPRALYRCAECYGKAGHPEWEAKALEILLQRYPMSEAAPLAQARLRSLHG